MIISLDEVIPEVSVVMSKDPIKSLEDIQSLRLGDNPFMFELLNSNFSLNIILPSVYVDFEKGEFVSKEDVNSNIISKKMELLRNVVSNNSFQVDVKLEGDLSMSVNVEDYLNRTDISDKEKIENIVNSEVFRNLFNGLDINALYNSYVSLRDENKDTTRQGTEINKLMPLISYVSLIEFNNIIKFSDSFNSLLKVNKEGDYVRKVDSKFDKQINQESSEVNIMEVGTELYKSIISNIPLLEIYDNKIIQKANLFPIQVTQAIIALKSLGTWTGGDIHNELKNSILRVIKPNSDINISPEHKNVLRSLYHFIYSETPITFVNKFNQEKTFNSLFSILDKYKNDSLALKFQTAIENIFNVVYPNYQISVIKEDDVFRTSNSIYNKTSPSRAKVIEAFKPIRLEKGSTTIEGINGMKLTPSQFAGFNLIDGDIPTKLGTYFMAYHYPMMPEDKAIEYMKRFDEEVNDIYLAYVKNNPTENNEPIDKYDRKFTDKQLKIDKAKNGSFFKEPAFLERANKIGLALDYMNNRAEKSVQMSVLGTATAKFTPTNNTLNIFDRSLRQNIKLFEGDLFDIFNNCK